MSIKSDRWIRRMALEQGMIEPFAPEQVRNASGGKIVSYGTSSSNTRCSPVSTRAMNGRSASYAARPTTVSR